MRVTDERTGEVIEVRLADEEGNGTALDVALALVPHFEVWVDVARMRGKSLVVRVAEEVEPLSWLQQQESAELALEERAESMGLSDWHKMTDADLIEFIAHYATRGVRASDERATAE